MTNHDKAITSILQGLAALGYSPPVAAGDAIEQFIRGELLDGVDAAYVAGRAVSTVARWAQEAHEGAPIAIKVGNAWLFVAQRLLDFIERKNTPRGLYARREAETRYRKLLETRACSQSSTPNASPRAGSVPEACDNADSKTRARPGSPDAGTRAVGME